LILLGQQKLAADYFPSSEAMKVWRGGTSMTWWGSFRRALLVCNYVRIVINKRIIPEPPVLTGPAACYKPALFRWLTWHYHVRSGCPSATSPFLYLCVFIMNITSRLFHFIAHGNFESNSRSKLDRRHFTLKLIPSVRHCGGQGVHLYNVLCLCVM
jgi:hypothetical protein